MIVTGWLPSQSEPSEDSSLLSVPSPPCSAPHRFATCLAPGAAAPCAFATPPLDGAAPPEWPFAALLPSRGAAADGTRAETPWSASHATAASTFASKVSPPAARAARVHARCGNPNAWRRRRWRSSRRLRRPSPESRAQGKFRRQPARLAVNLHAQPAAMDAVWRKWVTHYATAYPQSMSRDRRDGRIVRWRVWHVCAQGACGLVQVGVQVGRLQRHP